MVRVKTADGITESYWASREYKKWGVRLSRSCLKHGRVTDVKYVRAKTPEGAALVAEAASLKPRDVDYVQLASPAELGAVKAGGTGYDG